MMKYILAAVKFGEKYNNLKVTHFAPVTHCALGDPIKFVHCHWHTRISHLF